MKPDSEALDILHEIHSQQHCLLIITFY